MKSITLLSTPVCLPSGHSNPCPRVELFYDCVLFHINPCLLFRQMFKCLILSVDICLELIGPMGWGFLFSLGSFDPDTWYYSPPPFRFQRIMSKTNAVLWFTDNLNSLHIKLTVFLFARDLKCTCLVNHCVKQDFFSSQLQWQIRGCGSSDRRQGCCVLLINQPAKHTHTHRLSGGERRETKAPVAHFETNARSRVDFSLCAVFCLFGSRPCVTES